MAPFKSSKVRSAAKLFNVFRQADLDLRGQEQISRKPQVPWVASGGATYTPGNGYKYHRFSVPNSDTFAVTGGGAKDCLI